MTEGEQAIRDAFEVLRNTFEEAADTVRGYAATAVQAERERIADLVEEAHFGDVIRIPFEPRDMDHPQVDVPDLFMFCKRLAERIRSGE